MRERLLPAVLLPALLSLIGGCASDLTLRKAELASLVALVPGSYDNRAQVRAEEATPAPAAQRHEALALVIARIYAPAIGDHVFYVQETAADDPLRVLGQRLISFRVAPDEQLVQSLYSLNEPQRWRNAQRNLDLFKSLMVPDVRALGGCELTWAKVGEGFEAHNNPARCRTNSRATGEVLRVESKAKIDTEGLSLSDRHYDAAGRIVYGDFPDPFYHFQRRAD